MPQKTKVTVNDRATSNNKKIDDGITVYERI